MLIASNEQRDRTQVLVMIAGLSLLLFCGVFGYVAFGLYYYDVATRQLIYPGSMFALATTIAFVAFLLLPCMPPFSTTRKSLAVV